MSEKYITVNEAKNKPVWLDAFFEKNIDSFWPAIKVIIEDVKNPQLFVAMLDKIPPLTVVEIGEPGFESCFIVRLPVGIDQNGAFVYQVTCCPNACNTFNISENSMKVLYRHHSFPVGVISDRFKDVVQPQTCS